MTKPPPRRRQYGSTLPAPTKPIARSPSPLPRGGIRRSNPARKAKKAARYKAFLSSAVWKRLRREALARAGNRCEAVARWTSPVTMREYEARCPETEKLTVHHTTYARFGGKELPDDLEVRCKSCHDRHHALEGKRIA